MIEDSTTSLTTLLSDSSYKAEFLSQFVKCYRGEFPETYDSVIRLYDFEYDGDIDEVKFKSVEAAVYKSIALQSLEIINTSLDYDTFVRRLQMWSHYRGKGGVEGLPGNLIKQE